MKEKVLISVYNKKWIWELGKVLSELWYEIIATDWTWSVLNKYWVDYIPAQKITKNPNILNDCIQTISFNISWWILFNRENKKHISDVINENIEPISIVICNFPPVNEFLKSFDDFNIQHIDVWWPLMVRAAATNYKDVNILVNPVDYIEFIHNIKNNNIKIDYKKELAIKAFRYCKEYNNDIENYLIKN